MTKEYVLKDIGIESTFNIKPNYNIIFHRGNTQIGVLDFNGPEMTFSGDIDESAKLFLEFVATSFKGRLEQERAEEREACAKVCDEYDNGRHANAADLCATAIRARDQEGDVGITRYADISVGKIIHNSSPPQRTWVGLTQEEIEDSYNADYKAQTRAIEAKLKEKNEQIQNT